jgi:KDO2-lipid IV(A) lauroyltransferase
VSKKKSQLSNWIEYIFFKSILILVKIMPFSWNCWIWERVSLCAFHLFKSRRLLTLENIRSAKERGFLNKVDDEYKLAKKAWANLGLVSSEFLYYSTKTAAQLKKLVTVKNEENLKKVLSKKKGLVMVMGHIGNWELLGIFLSVLGYQLSPLVKIQSNSLTDSIIEEKRKSVGMKVIPNNGFLRSVVKAFKRNEIVPFLIDQDAHRKGIKVDFFGRKASIPPGAAEFSLRTDTPVIFAYTVRESSGHFKLVISEEIQLKRSGNYQQDLVDNISIFMNLLEDVVQDYPEQWLWMHSLWPTKFKI